MDQSTHENICTMLLNVNLREREVRKEKLKAESLPYPNKNKMESRNIGMLGSCSNLSITSILLTCLQDFFDYMKRM